ncbi:NAD(P)/FAD-dependent oxidoreductase [Hoyosella altamirensis]|uniref:3-phenylpropionate/trans-cinnamate dioxygenase ferredoxin reductase subunit n=1 Tax=Hoyosella altamirensis TaxID=616997 RepID=A0A839RHI6_9ACTN|nr:FAD-dependent oxidoreductase [Hoyosella altamirensis]MBB3035636.1 3-phenylpropionate/trans-cinnamate dioxygenase ferredoxin reductase subunit [Hoyosella altamirensis]
MTDQIAPDGTVVIIGSGVAAATAAESLRKEGFGGRVMMISNDAEYPYRRPQLSKELLQGTIAFERSRLRPPDFWEEQNVEIVRGATVTDIDTAERVVLLENGEQQRYDALLIATGGRPRAVPGFAPEEQSNVHYLRSVADVEPLRKAIEEPGALLIIGAGLIGCEVAATARGLGSEVILLEAGDRPLGRVLPEPVAEIYSKMHRDNGVDLWTNVELDQLDVRPDGVTAISPRGQVWSGSSALISVGMAPNTDLADRAGISIDTSGRGGIIVDKYCRTSDPHVYAAGDVAIFPNLLLGGVQRVEHWNNAQEQGAHAARAILGMPTPFADVPWCWTKQYGKNLQIAGWPSPDDELIVHGSLEDLDFTVLCLRNERLIGVISMGRPKEFRSARALINDAPYIRRKVLEEGIPTTAPLAIPDLSSASART